MDAKTLASSLCQQYAVRPVSNGLSVATPFRYDDGDPVVIFVALADGAYRVDDNGEAAVRLMHDGIDIDSARARQWLDSLPHVHGVTWDDDEERLSAQTVKPGLLPDLVMRVAECSVQMQALTALRVERAISDFKQQVVSVLREISKESGIEARYDVPVDKDQMLIADAYFLSQTPLAIIAAPSVQRLLEAQLIWANAQRMGDRMKVIAVVEDPTKIGMQQMMRANYFTDKTVGYKNMAASFRTLVRDTITH